MTTPPPTAGPLQDGTVALSHTTLFERCAFPKSPNQADFDVRIRFAVRTNEKEQAARAAGRTGRADLREKGSVVVATLQSVVVVTSAHVFLGLDTDFCRP